MGPVPLVTVGSLEEISRLPEDADAVAGSRLDDGLLLDLLKRCRELRVVSLMGCEDLTDRSLVRLGEIRRLEDLDLGMCHMMTDRTPKAISELPRLERLSLA